MGSFFDSSMPNCGDDMLAVGVEVDTQGDAAAKSSAQPPEPASLTDDAGSFQPAQGSARRQIVSS
jgi:hypothetical protein